MPINPQPQPGAAPIRALDVIVSAMQEINTIGANETPNARDAAWGLQKLQRLHDKLNAIRQAIYALNFKEWMLIPNHQPHTIGPGGDFDVPVRPVRIVNAAFILNPGQGTNEVDSPQIHIQDADWWAALPTKQLSSSIVTDLYYSPEVPLGKLFFWPICNVANPVRLETWIGLGAPLTQTTQLYYPQGYWDAVILTLAVEMCSAFDKEPGPTLGERARDAMKIIMANNAHPPRIRTDDSMPTPFPGGYGRPDFDFLTGLNDNNF